MKAKIEYLEFDPKTGVDKFDEHRYLGKKPRRAYMMVIIEEGEEDFLFDSFLENTSVEIKKSLLV